MKKKIVSLILASAMVVTTLAGCGSSGAQESSSAPVAAESESQAESEAPKEEAEAPAAPADENLSEIEKIIKEAEGMTMEEWQRKPSKNPMEKPSTV